MLQQRRKWILGTLFMVIGLSVTMFMIDFDLIRALIPCSTSVIDNYYTHHLVSINTVSNNTEKLRIVVAKFQEDLSWINSLDGIPVTVYNKAENPLPESTVFNNHVTEIPYVPNVGNECYSYLSFIIDNYYNLPELVVFVHGDPPKQYHSMPNIIREINNLKKLTDEERRNFGYRSLNAIYVFRCADVQVDWCCRLTGANMKRLYSFWNLGPDENRPICVGCPCCAQFVVSRKRIQRVSLQGYLQTFKTIAEKRENYCAELEHMWHILFGEQPILQGVPEETVAKHYKVIKPLIEKYPNQSCELDQYYRTHFNASGVEIIPFDRSKRVACK
jgi:hypothetical protein